MLISLKPSRVAMLPCLIIPLLWLLLPRPSFDPEPSLDPVTRSLAMRALETNRRINSRINRHLHPHHSSRSSNHRKKHAQSVLLVTAVSPKSCRDPLGDHIQLQSVKNKQDYARRHGLDFLLSMELTDARLSGAWNKVALIHRILVDSKVTTTADGGVGEYDWIVWMDYDALIVDMKFEMPFERYVAADRHLVLWGQERHLFEDGDAHMGLNTGVFLIRNSQWSIDLLSRVMEYGFGDGRDKEEELKQLLKVYDWALFDQNGFAAVLKQLSSDDRKNRGKVELETSYVINGYWKDFPLTKESPTVPFVSHFMGCQFCSGINDREADACKREFTHTLNHTTIQQS